MAFITLALVLVWSACGDPARGATPVAPAAPSGGAVARPGPAGGDGTRGATAARTRAEPFDPTAFRLALEEAATGFLQPVFATHAGDGSGRLFVIERRGLIRVVQGGQTAPEPFLDVQSIVRATGLEQGLLGLAFHPRYRENGRFFIAYTAGNGDNTLAEYRVSADPNRAEPRAVRVLFAIPDFAANHNGGMLAFGPDGYLYVATGDGGNAGDPRGNGQNTNALLGKILRVDVDQGEPYAIPADNPFAGGGGAPEVWAYGLRNPWRFSFDRATGDLWIADVGQGAVEEINLQPAGAAGGVNYGWNVMEGSRCFRPASGCDQSGLVLPVMEYGHDIGCSVTGGYVYRGSAYPALLGAYIFGDYCSGRIWALAQQDGAWRSTELLKPNAQISSFGEDQDGELYMTGLNSGIVYRLTAMPR